MASQPLVPASPARQFPSKAHLRRQIAGTARFAAPCALLAIAALGGCASDEPELDLAACDAPVVYRIDAVELPRDTSGAVSLGLDLDLDDAAAPDNQLGFALSLLHSRFQPLDVAAVTSDRLEGEVAWKLATRACGDRVAISVGRVDRLDELQLVGRAASARLSARGDTAELPLSLMFDPSGAVADPGWLSGVRAAIELDRSADGSRFSAKLGLALDPATVSAAITPPLAPFLDAHTGDHPELLTHLDQNRDGRITEPELRGSPLFRSLLAPDIQIDGAPALSLGLGLSGAREP